MTQGLFTVMFIDKYLLKIFSSSLKSKLQAFAGNPLFGAVCTNCFEKCTYFFANITEKDDSRNAPKRLRKTVFRFETMDPERREGRCQGHHRGGGEGVESREINEGRGRVGGGEGEGVQRRRGEGERGRGGEGVGSRERNEGRGRLGGGEGEGVQRGKGRGEGERGRGGEKGEEEKE